MVWRQNEGNLPPECVVIDDEGEVTGYRKVHVRLRNGWDSQKAGHAPWPAADARPPTRWTLRNDSHDIMEFLIA